MNVNGEGGDQAPQGGNMDIDLLPNPDVSWHIEPCPWNEDEEGQEHKCAVKNTSICKHFRGIEPLDSVRCAYPKKNRFEVLFLPE